MLLPGPDRRETACRWRDRIGSSARLNLFFDTLPLRLCGARRTGYRPPGCAARRSTAAPGTCGGAGSDIAPANIRPRTEAAPALYVWADQSARLARLDAAIWIASQAPFELEKADAAAFVRKRLQERRQGEAFVLFHSIMWQYMPRASKDGVLAALEEASAQATGDAPIARLDGAAGPGATCDAEPDDVA